MPDINRRGEDPRLNQVVIDVANVKQSVELISQELRRNSDTTDQIRDLLATFRVTAHVCKWVAAVGAAVVAVWQGWDLFRR